MTRIIRSEIETATRGAVIWGVPTPEATVWFKRKWAAQFYVAGLAEGKGPQTLADLKADKTVEWIAPVAV